MVVRREIPGVGEAKLKHYGEAFTGAIREALAKT